MSKFEISDGDDPRLYEDGRYIGVLDLPAEQAAHIVKLLNEGDEGEADKRRLEWLLSKGSYDANDEMCFIECGWEIESPALLARLEHKATITREAIDEAIAAAPASKEPDK